MRLAETASQAVGAADGQALAAAAATEPGEAPGAGPGVSKGRTGDFKEELRVESLERRARARGALGAAGPAQGWQLQEAPPMLPAQRYAEAIAAAVRAGVLVRATHGV